MKKVYVGMSGGVDSSIVAMMMRDDGYEVIGVFIKTWSPDYIECTWREDRLDAMRVAAALGIKFETIDLSDEYKKGVIDYMISEYKAGRTPNPDIMCNREVKFGAFYKHIKSLDPKAYLATGHYAGIIETHPILPAGEDLGGGAFCLAKAIDQSKDQVYFLSQVDKSILPYIMFPLGKMKKPEVRNIARTNNLYVSEKRDSQGLCMLGDISIKDFLKKEIGEQIHGKILNSDHEVLGEHNGAIFYTIGERIAVSSKETNRGIYYVVSKDIINNLVFVSTKLKSEENINKKTFNIQSWNSTSSIDIAVGKEYEGQTRYHGPLYKFKILEISKNNTINNDTDIILSLETIDKNVLYVSGQTLVLYQGDIMVGGGICA